jgi:protease IV
MEKNSFSSGLRDYTFWLLKLFTWVIIIFFIAPLLLITAFSTIANRDSLVTNKSDKSIAVVELSGTIMDAKEVVEQIYKNAYDDTIAGIILKIDSPGGAVGPSQEIFNAVLELKKEKPIVAVMSSVAASGGLYAALGASKIFSQPGTLTGSIGVIMQFPNLEKISETVGFQMITVKSGKLKDVGNPFRGLGPEEEEYLNQTLDLIHRDFIQAVVKGRGIDQAQVEKFADGRILTGLQAKELGIVDDFGGVYKAAREIFKLIGDPLADDELPDLRYARDRISQFKDLLNAVGILPTFLTANHQPMAIAKP